MEQSPYHDLEIEAQERSGRAQFARSLAIRIKDDIVGEPQDFLPTLPFIVLGSVDASGRLWASIVGGREGFISVHRSGLKIEAVPALSDPVYSALQRNSDLGLIAIDFTRRLRYRINGKAHIEGSNIVFDVAQCYRNCPQYIHARKAEFAPDAVSPDPREPKWMSRLDDASRDMIARGDTFFIATHGAGHDTSSPALGADVSHRGGNPGFVSVSDDGSRLTFPDYVGNFMFNTIGNLARYPKCGLLFVDFETGSTLQISGTAVVDWTKERAAKTSGAQRMIDLDIEHAVLSEAALPIRWTLVERAPDLERFRVQSAIGKSLVRTLPSNPVPGFRKMGVAGIVQESNSVKSFELRPVEGSLSSFRPGQHLRVAMPVGGRGTPLFRCYSFSSFDPDADAFRIAVRRSNTPAERSGSNFMHDNLHIGSELLVSEPLGDFVLDEDRTSPVALISLGVGITPLLSMLQYLVATKSDREITFIHGARNKADQAFPAEVQRAADGRPNVTAHICYDEARPIDVQGRDFDTRGRLDADLVERLVAKSADVYICGPLPFMESLRAELIVRGYEGSRIFFEVFGGGGGNAEAEPLGQEGSMVRFDSQDVEYRWNAEFESILELAEANGLSPPYSCRIGVCGSCEHRLVSGEVAYSEPPGFEPQPGHVLICCAQPVSNVVLQDTD